MTKQKYLLPILALIMANALWGINTPVIKVELESIPTPAFPGIVPIAIYALTQIGSWDIQATSAKS